MEALIPPGRQDVTWCCCLRTALAALCLLCLSSRQRWWGTREQTAYKHWGTATHDAKQPPFCGGMSRPLVLSDKEEEREREGIMSGSVLMKWLRSFYPLLQFKVFSKTICIYSNFTVLTVHHFDSNTPFHLSLSSLPHIKSPLTEMKSWQGSSCMSFDSFVIESWIQKRNLYYEIYSDLHYLAKILFPH